MSFRLYSGSTPQFIADTRRNRITDKLREAFFEQMGFNPSPGEITSWQNSLRAMADVVDLSGLQEHGVLLEYQLPLSSKRLDCMITGRSEASVSQAVVIELKQWSEVDESGGENEVVTYVGKGHRDVLHPSVQVRQYRDYLSDVHTAFSEGDDPVRLLACSYLHNYLFRSPDALLASKFKDVLAECPVFGADDVDRLASMLQGELGGGEGLDVLRRVEESRFRPSKKLMDHVAGVIQGRPEYVLLDEQLVVFDKVFAAAKSGFHDRRKRTVIIKGGPGTGKSVVALNLLARLSQEGFATQYATGSKAFTQSLRAALGRRAGSQLTYFNGYAQAQPDELDVIISDEAHRIRATSASRFTPASKRTGLPQIIELLRAARVTVFFIDDDQVVRPKEVGSASYIRQMAEQEGHVVEEFELEAQFRCGGSDAFVNWMNNTLGIRRTANALWDPAQESFDFQIMRSPEEVEAAIRERSGAGQTARMTAGFCWPWSKELDAEGALISDVQVSEYSRPWNAHHDLKRVPPGIPKAEVWAYDPNGIDQVGCVYTAQGFEFDYVGVIFGRDLRYDPDAHDWIGDKSESHDREVKTSKDHFVDLVKNTYRVLLTRGMKGCYVCFLDKDTERFVRSRMR
jgi:uncharacterized protein